jgi:hypothetical protein
MSSPIDMVLDAATLVNRKSASAMPSPLATNAEIAGRLQLSNTTASISTPNLQSANRSSAPARAWGQFTLRMFSTYEDILDGSGDGDVGVVDNYETPTLSDDYSSNDQRFLTRDAGSVLADSDDAIAYFRILKRDMTTGVIDTQSQIFPKPKGITSINEDMSVAKYKKMIILNKMLGLAERAQIIKTNTMLHVYFFDSQYETIQISGALKRNWDDPWDLAMVLLWDQLMRGTQLVRRGYVCELGMDQELYWGYPLHFNLQTNSQTQYLATFTMTFLIIDRSVNMSYIDDYVKDMFDDLGVTDTNVTDGMYSLNNLGKDTAQLENVSSSDDTFNPISGSSNTDMSVFDLKPGVPNSSTPPTTK